MNSFDFVTGGRYAWVSFTLDVHIRDHSLLERRRSYVHGRQDEPCRYSGIARAGERAEFIKKGTTMPPDTSISLINLGKLAKPADTLIKKISSAAGILYEPRQIKRIAKAEAKAALMKARSEIEVTDLHRRAAHRWIEEEAQQQKIMEDITAKALPQLNESAKTRFPWITTGLLTSSINAVSCLIKKCRNYGRVFLQVRRTLPVPIRRGPSISFRISIREKPICSPGFVDSDG